MGFRLTPRSMTLDDLELLREAMHWQFGEMEFVEIETKHVELEQFWHAFASRGFDSVSWAFLCL